METPSIVKLPVLRSLTLFLASLGVVLSACSFLVATQPPQPPTPEPAQRLSATELSPPPATGSPSAAAPTLEDATEATAGSLDETWTIPLGGLYILSGSCRDAMELARRATDGSISEGTATEGLILLQDDLSIVQGALIDWQPTEDQAAFSGEVLRLPSGLDGIFHMRLSGEISPSQALEAFERECSTLPTLLAGLEELAMAEGIPGEELADFRAGFEGMPSVFDLLGD